MQLRDYQREAVNAGLSELRLGRHPVLQLATGTGKSLIIAALVAEYQKQGRRVWVLTHVQQLIQQNCKAYAEYVPGAEYGIVCAGLNRFDYAAQVVFGTIQSIARPAEDGRADEPDLIIIDEAHRVPHNDGEPSLYAGLFGRYSNAQRLAMTATPWRMDNGRIYGDGEQFWFDVLAYDYGVPQAVADGWLCPLVGVSTEVQLELDGVPIQGDYVQKEVGDRETAEWLRAVAQSLSRLASNRRHVAVYCPTVTAAVRAVNAIHAATGWEAEIITGGMSREQRGEILFRFRSGMTKVLCSVDTITTGFDLPSLDCIVCLRPTQSSSLWVQIQGRGTRLHPDKDNCLVLDYVGNLQRLGGVAMYETYLVERGGEVAAELEAVPQPPEKPQRRQLPGLTSLKPIDPMTGNEATEGCQLTVRVHAVTAFALVPRGKTHPVMVVQYTCTTPENARVEASLFLDTEHPAAREFDFFKTRRLAVNLPAPARQLLWAVRNAALPGEVAVRRRGRYWNVTREYLTTRTNTENNSQ